MTDQLKIYVQQLAHGKREEINATLPPDFLQLDEKELSSHAPIRLQGEVFASEDLFIFQFSALTEVKIPCSVCNEMTYIPLEAKEIYYTLPLSELTSQIFDLSDVVREELVLLIPSYVECHEGRCPERKELTRFMKTKTVSPDHHFPFADL